MGDPARCSLRFAVGQGKGHAGVHADGVKTTIRRDDVAVEAQHHAFRRLPRLTFYHYILGQVVVPRLGDGIQTGNALPDLVGVLPVRARLAADGMGMQVAVGKDDAVAEKQFAVCGVVAGKGVQVVLCQRSMSAAALGDGDIVLRGNSVRRGHADRRWPAGQRAGDLDGFAAHQIDVFSFVIRILVAGDGHIAGNGESGGQVYRRIHAAAVFGGVVGDAAALHDEVARAGQIHTPAATLGSVRLILCDSAVVHGEVARQNVHAAAITTIVGCVVGDAAAIQIETGRIGSVRKRHTTASAGGVVAGDAAAVHIECTFDGHAATAALFAIAVHPVGDLAGLCLRAVTESECRAGCDIDDGLAALGPREAVAVQAEIERVIFCHSQGRTLRVARQIDVGGFRFGIIGDGAHAVPWRPVHIAARARMVADVLMRRAANGMLMGQAVVEVHVDAVGARALLHLDEVSPARVGGEIVLRAAVRPAGGDGDRLAGGDPRAGHADLGRAVQLPIDRDGPAGEQIHVVGRVVLLVAGVAGNVHLAGHGKGGGILPHTHAAAGIAGDILCNAAAGHGERAAIYVHTAALAVVLAGRGVSLDRAAGHGKFTAVHIHAAAVAQGCIFANAAAVHMERTAVHIHTGANAVVAYIAALVVVNLSVVQRECTARPDDHAVTVNA